VNRFEALAREPDVLLVGPRQLRGRAPQPDRCYGEDHRGNEQPDSQDGVEVYRLLLTPQRLLPQQFYWQLAPLQLAEGFPDQGLYHLEALESRTRLACTQARPDPSTGSTRKSRRP
jgi:hypothetical protein